MADVNKFKFLAVTYIVFWLGVFGVVVNDRFSADQSQSILSELAVFAKTHKDVVKDAPPLFATPYLGDTATSTKVEDISTEVEYRDRRAEAIAVFLSRYPSPMKPQARVFVEQADKYNFDWRLSVAIAMIETGAGNAAPGHAYGNYTYNAFGFKTREGYIVFESWEDSIKYAARRFGEGYGIDNLDPETMEASYCPTCAESTPGKWANGVKHYMAQLKVIYESLDSEGD